MKQLHKWNNSCRYSYNKTIWLMKEDSTLSKLDLRNLITPEIVNSRNPWILETPKAIREASVFEAYKNRSACITNLKNENIKFFNLRFLSKKNKTWTINGVDSVKKINSKCIKIFPDYNFGYVKTKEIIPDTFKTCAIHFDGIHYYILMPIEREKKK